ncbi:MAG: hypothetical protein KatS3mg097_589 [Candidatus Parcubacteria bacterium]|nr:MAG: hypothetical protein KatS3mg097_589 [Candidatus Parcubacteria bacterium]
MTVKALSYTILVLIAIFLFLNYYWSDSYRTINFLDFLLLSGSIAIVVITISIFFLWNDDTVKILENYLGAIGHVLHCGFCFCLWLSMFVISFFHLVILDVDIFGNNLDMVINFFINWLSLSFVSVLFFEVITILWFKKVLLEFNLRDKYKNKS